MRRATSGARPSDRNVAPWGRRRLTTSGGGSVPELEVIGFECGALSTAGDRRSRPGPRRSWPRILRRPAPSPRRQHPCHDLQPGSAPGNLSHGRRPDDEHVVGRHRAAAVQHGLRVVEGRDEDDQQFGRRGFCDLPALLRIRAGLVPVGGHAPVDARPTIRRTGGVVIHVRGVGTAVRALELRPAPRTGSCPTGGRVGNSSAPSALRDELVVPADPRMLGARPAPAP